MFDCNNEDFLWFVNFGITRTQAEEDHNKALTCCISSAYNDACRHINYLRSVSEINAMKNRDSSDADKETAIEFESKKEEFKRQCSIAILNGIQELLSSGTIDYDCWHRNLCTGKELGAVPDGLFKDNSQGLTIGQIQKWVNMSIKNMLIMSFWDNALAGYKGKIHVPIDDKIYNKAKEEVGVITVLPKEWNKISNYDEYMRFQEELRNKLKTTPPIVWEWETWLQ